MMQTSRYGYLKITFSILLGLLVFIVKAQKTYNIPDNNFRFRMLTNYSWMMKGGQLDSAMAASFIGDLDFSNAGIENADGIQYFTNVLQLNLNQNKLVSLPEIPRLTKLQRLFLTSNQLVSLPMISHCTQLIELQVQNNQLTQLPNFTTFSALTKIYASNNKLTTLPDISKLKQLTVLEIGNNKLGILPDVSPLVNLKELHVNQTDCDTIIGLSKLTKLEVLYAWGNRIKDLSAIDSNTTLNTFQVFQNSLTALPYLLNKPNLGYVAFSNNYLTFKDILPLMASPNFYFFSYNPQKQIVVNDFVERERNQFLMSTFIDTSVSSNQYEWYKDDGLVADTNKSSLLFNSLSFTDAGNYKVIIKNPILPELILESTSFSLSVLPCLHIATHQVNQSFVSCEEGYDLGMDITIDGGTAPFNYSLLNKQDLPLANSSRPSFTFVKSGSYKVQISDSKQCNSFFEVVVASTNECDLVFTPNGDGVMDTYFVQETGKVKIYNVARELVAEFFAPASWDGTKLDGASAESGLYAITIGNKVVARITLIK